MLTISHVLGMKIVIHSYSKSRLTQSPAHTRFVNNVSGSIWLCWTTWRPPHIYIYECHTSHACATYINSVPPSQSLSGVACDRAVDRSEVLNEIKFSTLCIWLHLITHINQRLERCVVQFWMCFHELYVTRNLVVGVDRMCENGFQFVRKEFQRWRGERMQWRRQWKRILYRLFDITIRRRDRHRMSIEHTFVRRVMQSDMMGWWDQLYIIVHR